MNVPENHVVVSGRVTQKGELKVSVKGDQMIHLHLHARKNLAAASGAYLAMFFFKDLARQVNELIRVGDAIVVPAEIVTMRVRGFYGQMGLVGTALPMHDDSPAPALKNDPPEPEPLPAAPPPAPQDEPLPEY